MKMVPVVLGFLLGMIAIPALAETHFESSLARTSLIELYTSEGCSSCPPAEARLSRLKDDRGLWKQFVPVAYHVDYWNRLGWRDRFSSPEFTARQSRYAALWQSESVYTPAFVLDGRELRGGWSGSLSSPNEQAAGLLNATSQDGKTWSIEFHPAQGGEGDWDVHAALLGAGISSKIGAGENDGRNLQHDFVVLHQQDAPLKKEGDRAIGSLTLASSAGSAPQKALAVWVTRRGQLPPVQATGGWLPTP
ncbi:MAG: DUF1223 domain-containing protein [Chthoniobacterales bacterium]|nr:DUF1223 domain-containing protein [Chthoniobacterales bacterium]